MVGGLGVALRVAWMVALKVACREVHRIHSVGNGWEVAMGCR